MLYKEEAEEVQFADALVVLDPFISVIFAVAEGPIEVTVWSTDSVPLSLVGSVSTVVPAGLEVVFRSLKPVIASVVVTEEPVRRD